MTTPVDGVKKPADANQVDVTLENTSISLFLKKNPKLAALKKVRDGQGGIFKLINVAIFGFLLFAPALPIIPTMEEPAVVVALWAVIICIMWFKIEYTHRAEVWFMCLYRGVILDFPKTNSPKGWLCQIPTFLAIVFLLTFGVVTYIGLDPKFDIDNHEHLITAIMAIVGILFVLFLTKGFVDLEGANQLLSLNLVVFLLEDPELLKDKGFSVVHFSQLQAFVNGDKGSFSWDRVHALSHERETRQGFSPIAGTKMFMFLKKFKDSDK